MNKHIKNKKKQKLEFNKHFSKQEKLFMRKYPNLFAISSFYNIEYRNINRIFKKINKNTLHCKNTIENIIRIRIITTKENYQYRVGNSRGYYYQQLFKELGINIKA